MPKNLKRGHLGSLNVFYKPKTSKKCKGVPFDKIRKLCRIMPKKTQRGDPLVSPVLLEALKIYGLVPESNPRPTAWSKMNKYER